MANIYPLIRKRVDSSDNPFWISYADLMTALVMLFLVVMSISMVAVASRPLVEKKVRESEISDILNLLDLEAQNKKVDIVIDRNTHTISFGDQARFAFDSFQLSEAARQRLRQFVPLLLETEKDEKTKRWLKRVHIEGYTDATGTYLYNVNLSLNRAQAVVCALFAGELTEEQRQRLRQLLIIDGASTTSIKESPGESRRVEVHLEFRSVGDVSVNHALPNMPLGNCAIPIGENTKSKPVEPVLP
ncbi:MAG: OmpA family protein [Magnetococcus sp. DMHC-6]